MADVASSLNIVAFIYVLDQKILINPKFPLEITVISLAYNTHW